MKWWRPTTPLCIVRGIVLVAAIAVMAYFFPSPYVPAIRIADVALQDPALITTTLQHEYDHTSDTAKYSDSIDPYNFDTRQVFVIAPYEKIVGGAASATQTTSELDRHDQRDHTSSKEWAL